MEKSDIIGTINYILDRLDEIIDVELVEGMEICAEQFDKITLIHEEFRGVRQQLEEGK